MVEADIELLYKWANEPHVKQWWKTESDPKKFQERYQALIKNGRVQASIVYQDETPIGYLHFWMTSSDPQFVHLYPEGAARVGGFIGDPSALGKGHGTRMIREFTDKLLQQAEITMIMTIVDKSNQGAIKAYKAAGFRHDADMESTSGPIALLERKRTWKMSSVIKK